MLMDYVREWVHPDINFSRKPQLPEAIDRAARAAGGLLYLRECSTDDLQWARKRFIEAREQWDQLDNNQFVLADPKLKKLFTETAEKMSVQTALVGKGRMYATSK